MKKLILHISLLIAVIVSVSSALGFAITRAVLRFAFPELDSGAIFLFGITAKEFVMPVISLLIALLMVGLIMRQTTEPLTGLTAGIRKIAAGDYSVRLEEHDSNSELADLAVSFNKMARELQSSEVMRKDFAASISHQFKTPLSIIQGYSRLLEEDGISDADRKRYAALITRQSERMAALSSNILRLSRLESSAIISSPSTFILDEQLRQCVVTLEPKWSRKNIDFSVRLPNVIYTGDEELLENVWVNIIDNAIKYTPDGGRIEVALIESKSKLLITVTDSGEGMDEATLERAFSPYFHGGSGEGSGLGLPIAKRIVELHGGRISISSLPGEGTTVTVLLPATDIIADTIA